MKIRKLRKNRINSYFDDIRVITNAHGGFGFLIYESESEMYKDLIPHNMLNKDLNHFVKIKIEEIENQG